MPETRTVKGFSEVRLPLAKGDFECSSLQPLRYASVYKYSLLGTNHMISSQPRYDHFDTAACHGVYHTILSAGVQLLFLRGIF